MARYTGPKNRLSRREGIDLFGKGNKLRRASQIPGQHGPKGSRRPTDYGLQLREKQKTKRLYGVTERQFARYVKKATAIRGKTGEALLRILETRLDNVVYRLGITNTRNMARQLVSHGHVLVNNHKMTTPSFLVKPGQMVTLDAKAVIIPVVKERLENPEIHLPAWLERQASVGKILALPDRSDIDSQIDEQLIVEFYSR